MSESFKNDTLPETSITPENGWLEDDRYKPVQAAVFREVIHSQISPVAFHVVQVALKAATRLEFFRVPTKPRWHVTSKD